MKTYKVRVYETRVYCVTCEVKAPSAHDACKAIDREGTAEYQVSDEFRESLDVDIDKVEEATP